MLQKYINSFAPGGSQTSQSVSQKADCQVGLAGIQFGVFQAGRALLAV